MPKKIYLDESGDLGWNFTLPYRRGGSSRFLTIGYIIIPDPANAIPQRIVRKTYKKFGLDPQKEYKGGELTNTQKDFFVNGVLALLKQRTDFKLGAITVKKGNVQNHIRTDGNKLYNYMIRLAILHTIQNSPQIKLIRDERNIKVRSGNCLIDYLQTTLWFDYKSQAILIDIPSASHNNNNLIFIDWITHFVWANYEDGLSKHFKTIECRLSNVELFF